MLEPAVKQSIYLKLLRRFSAPVDSLPLDLFRVLVGLVVFVYFLQTLFEAKDFSGPDGLIDHELSQKIFWFTRIGFFHPGPSLRLFQAIFLAACLCCWPVILGYRVKLFAAILYLIAVSTYRWNFLVMYVDDSVVHLALFWLLLLPVGRTLVAREWLANRRDAWERWKQAKAPGAAVRCFMWNLALIYVVAGLWKWTSPMWRDGSALYVILKLPISLTPNLWQPSHFTALRLLSYCALIAEPLFALIFILPRGHRAKYGLLVVLLGFHLGTLVTLRIPYANVACIAALVIPFGGELMNKLRQGQSESIASFVPTRLAFSGIVALAFVTVLTLAMISSVTLPEWRAPSRVAAASSGQNVQALSAKAGLLDRGTTSVGRFNYEGLPTLQWSFFSVLWCMGQAQQYQLFNWIDERNYTVHYDVIEMRNQQALRRSEPGTVMPQSTRGNLLQVYMHGLTWMRIPPERKAELQSSLQLRFARRYCQEFHPDGEVTFYSTLERVYAEGNRIEEDHVPFMKFKCEGDEPRMSLTHLDM
jgi:hypothetical protein